MINYLGREKNWQTQLADLVTEPAELLSLLQLEARDVGLSQQACQQFRLRVPRQFVARMQVGNPLDPLLLQVLPHHLELSSPPDFVYDPLAELQLIDQHPDLPAGMLHKYASRVLLTMTGACAIHCRYCFRRHFPYQEQFPRAQHWQQFADYIQQHPDINEVILSGGDPLTLSHARLTQWIGQIAQLPQITTLRLHSRVPVVIPERIDNELLALLAGCGLQVVLVVHANHAQELGAEFDRAMAQLQRIGVTLLNQSVLLRGINDNVTTLTQLSYRLWHAHVLPYYLHVLDHVIGAAHFLIHDDQACALQRGLLAQLPGYLVPRLVREEPGVAHKSPITN